MTILERIANENRITISHNNPGDGGDGGDPIIPGRDGHLYTDAGKVMVCFSDDGRKRPFPTKQFKTFRLKILQPFIKHLKQEGDFEFIAEIEDTREAITKAIRVLHIKYRRRDHGISRPLPDALREAVARKKQGAGA
jgi:hypothetical protein